MFVYSYSNPHFILGPAVVWGIMCLRKNWKLGLAVPLVTLLGLVAGMLLHPQAPNTFLLWKIQCVDVPLQMLHSTLDIDLGAELLRPGAVWLQYNCAVPILAVVNLALAVFLVVRRNRQPLGADTVFFLVLQTVAIPGFFLSHRVVEYAVPFTILASCTLWRQLRDAAAAPRLGVAYLLAILVAPTLALPATSNLRPDEWEEFKQFGEWAQKHLPAGTLVANVSWGDFTRLYYAAPQYRYLVGMEPMFGYAFRPDVVQGLHDLRWGKVAMKPAELRQLTGADFAFVNRSEPVAQTMVQQLGYAAVYAGRDGVVFDLRR